VPNFRPQAICSIRPRKWHSGPATPAVWCWSANRSFSFGCGLRDRRLAARREQRHRIRSGLHQGFRARRNDTRLYVSENNYRNFIDCVKSRKSPIQPVETGHRTASLCHLGNLAMILKRKIKWDPEKETIVGDSEAAGMAARPLRAPGLTICR